MAEFSRLIEVDINTVFFDPEDEGRCAVVDCSDLKQKNIKYVAEQDNVMWVETTPFTGRIYEFDREEVDLMFQNAETVWTEENEAFMANLDVTPQISAYYGMLALEKMGYLVQFQEWTVSTERTPQEKMFFGYKTSWRRDDAILLNGLTKIGFNDQQIDDMFELAVNL